MHPALDPAFCQHGLGRGSDGLGKLWRSRGPVVGSSCGCAGVGWCRRSLRRQTTQSGIDSGRRDGMIGGERARIKRPERAARDPRLARVAPSVRATTGDGPGPKDDVVAHVSERQGVVSLGPPARTGGGCRRTLGRQAPRSRPEPSSAWPGLPGQGVPSDRSRMSAPRDRDGRHPSPRRADRPRRASSRRSGFVGGGRDAVPAETAIGRSIPRHATGLEFGDRRSPSPSTTARQPRSKGNSVSPDAQLSIPPTTIRELLVESTRPIAVSNAL